MVDDSFAFCPHCGQKIEIAETDDKTSLILTTTKMQILPQHLKMKAGLPSLIMRTIKVSLKQRTNSPSRKT